MTLNPQQIEHLRQSSKRICIAPKSQIAEHWQEWSNANIDRITSPEKLTLVHTERILPIIWILKSWFDVPGRIVFTLMKEQLVLQVAQMDAHKANFIDYESTISAWNSVVAELKPMYALNVKRVRV